MNDSLKSHPLVAIEKYISGIPFEMAKSLSKKIEKDEANRNNGEDSSTICRMDHSHNNHHYISYHVHHPLFCILLGVGFE